MNNKVFPRTPFCTAMTNDSEICDKLPKNISPLKSTLLCGQCSCGMVKYESPYGSEIWGIFYCHCSMCPLNDAETHGGVGWAAVPRPQYIGPLCVEYSSDFAMRGYCKECHRSVFIRYQCEDYTDWVLQKTIRKKSDPPKSWHIHCKGRRSDFNDKLPVYQGWACWDPDPCRPKTCLTPKVCFRCYLKSWQCGCPNGPLLERPEDGCEINVTN